MTVLLYPSLQAPVLTPEQEPEQITESRWHQPWSEPVRQAIAPALAIALLASGVFFPPPSQGEIVTADKWFAWLSEPVRQKPGLTAAQQPFYFAEPAGQTQGERTSEDKWHQPWSEPIRLDLRHRFGAHLQQVLAVDPVALATPEVTTESRWHQAWSEPAVKAKVGLRTAANPFLFYVQTVFGEPPTFDKWAYPWSEPIHLDLRNGLRADQQRAVTQGTDPLPLHPICYGYIIT